MDRPLSERANICGNDDRARRPSRDDFSGAISGYLERNPDTSCREIAKDLFVLKTPVSRVLEETGSRLFIAK
jgi:hypothetical protein